MLCQEYIYLQKVKIGVVNRGCEGNYIVER